MPLPRSLLVDVPLNANTPPFTHCHLLATKDTGCQLPSVKKLQLSSLRRLHSDVLVPECANPRVRTFRSGQIQTRAHLCCEEEKMSRWWMGQGVVVLLPPTPYPLTVAFAAIARYAVSGGYGTGKQPGFDSYLHAWVTSVTGMFQYFPETLANSTIKANNKANNKANTPNIPRTHRTYREHAKRSPP